MDRKRAYLIFALILATAIAGTYLAASLQYRQHESHAVEQAKLKQANTDKLKADLEKDKVEANIFKLRVCINSAQTKEAQTSCFLQYEAGVLSEPTIDDLNKLPTLY